MYHTDQIGHEIKLLDAPKRIISLVPSQTEFLFDIGLHNELIALTRFCIYPADRVKSKVKIGGTKNFSIQKIRSLKPDLIIGNKEENYEEGIAILQQEFPVWMSDITSLGDALDMMTSLGKICGAEARAKSVVERIEASFSLLLTTETRKKSVAYFIWRKPYMVAASGTFIDAMLMHLSCYNVFQNKCRYPEISLEELKEAQPEFIFLSSEPYSFSARHFEEFREAVPKAKVILVEGEMFSWYGSRLLQTPDYFRKLCELYF